ncbi:MAG: pectin acetylesterase-family hydrolase [Bacteroidota bacterium]
MKTLLPLFIILFSAVSWCGCNPTTDDDFDPTTPFDGAEADRGSWKWVPLDGLVTRTGAATGIGVRLADEDAAGLMIYLQGGGACFNDASCSSNPKTFDANDFLSWAIISGNSGILNKNQAANPVKDWHMVFVPYTTGDLHFGQNPSADPATDEKNFVGYDNMQIILSELSTYFTAVDDVLLTGSSAGGYGATFNWAEAEAAFGSTPVHLVNDCGPLPADDLAFAPCLQQRFRDDFQLDASLPAACTDCFSVTGDSLDQLYDYYGQSIPGTEGNLGLLAFKEDAVIRAFFDFGTDDCVNLEGAFGSYAGSVMEEAIVDLNDNHLSPNGWSTFMMNGTQHVALAGANFYNKTINGTTLAEWVESVINGTQLNLVE